MTNAPVLLRFADLAAQGIVRNREQLRRLIAEQRFPPGWMLSSNARVWDRPVVESWLEERRAASSQRSVAVS